MKTTLLKFSVALAAVALFTYEGCKKDDAKKEEQPAAESWDTTKVPVFFYYTGSECNPCGSVGIPNYYNVLSQCTKVTPVAVHCNAPANDNLYQAQAGGDLLQFIIANNSYSAPTFLIPPNAKFSGSQSNAVALAKQYITTSNQSSTEAAVKATAKYEGGMWTVSTRTKFLKDCNGTYNVSVYATEDSVKFHQLANGQMVNPYYHSEVLRQAFGGPTVISTWGEQIGTGAVPSGTIKTMDFTGAVPFADATHPERNWNGAHMSAVVIVWKVTTSGNTTKLDIINSSKIKLPY